MEKIKRTHNHTDYRPPPKKKNPIPEKKNNSSNKKKKTQKMDFRDSKSQLYLKSKNISCSFNAKHSLRASSPLSLETYSRNLMKNYLFLQLAVKIASSHCKLNLNSKPTEVFLEIL